MARRADVLLALLLVLLCAEPATARSNDATPGVRLPAPGAAWDYQIGGARPVPTGVQVVVRDRSEAPAGEYPVCYVNGFQAQPDQARFWNAPRRRGLLLTDGSGRRVTDAGWGEWLLDTRTPAKRARLTAIMARWVRACGDKGYAAVEFDNLDSYTRSRRLLTRRDNVAYARLLTEAAHRAGLAVAQKNAVELADRRGRIGFDFAIVEECGRWSECEAYADAYDGRAYLVEYRAEEWEAACAAVGDRVSVILRDRMVTPAGPYRGC